MAISLQNGQSIFYTSQSCLTPGHWHHLAITTRALWNDPESPQRAADFQIYLDGKLIPHEAGGNALPKFGAEPKLSLGSKLDGQIKLLRGWGKHFRATDAAGSLFKYLRKADGTLPDSCFAEFAFDEGVGNGAALSGVDYQAEIGATQERIDATANGIW